MPGLWAQYHGQCQLPLQALKHDVDVVHLRRRGAWRFGDLRPPADLPHQLLNLGDARVVPPRNPGTPARPSLVAAPTVTPLVDCFLLHLQHRTMTQWPLASITDVACWRRVSAWRASPPSGPTKCQARNLHETQSTAWYTHDTRRICAARRWARLVAKSHRVGPSPAWKFGWCEAWRACH